MSKYIDRAALFNSLSNAKTVEEIFAAIQAAPAEDGDPVRRGRWEDGKRMRFDGTFHWFRQCSECLYEREDDTPEKDTNYCPNCGSRMDLEEEKK